MRVDSGISASGFLATVNLYQQSQDAPGIATCSASVQLTRPRSAAVKYYDTRVFNAATYIPTLRPPSLACCKSLANFAIAQTFYSHESH